MNQVSLIGRLTRDPVIRYLDNEKNTCVASYYLAVPRIGHDRKRREADYISVCAYGALAELTRKYLSQGKRIGIVGSIETDAFPDKETGKMIHITRVIVKSMDFLSNKDTESEAGSGEEAMPEFLVIPPDESEDELPFR